MKKSQQEMIGFVLIVLIVVIASMVLLILSLRNPDSTDKENAEITSLLSSIMKYTTECAIVYEPDYDTIEDLIKDCYDNKKCENLNRDACDYLSQLLNEILIDAMKTESQVTAYQLNITYEYESNHPEDVLSISNGDCLGISKGSYRQIRKSPGDIVLRLQLFYE